MTSWTIVIPFKGTALGKSRLASKELSDATRQQLAESFLLDVIGAVTRTPQVSRVIVSGPDPQTQALLSDTPCEVLTEPAQISGLNAGVQWALQQVDAPHIACAVLTSDLPFLREHELEFALTLAANHERSMVTDREGAGTTLLLANRTPEFAPAFGQNSRVAHELIGFSLLNVPPSSGLRQDVDTPDHLYDSAGLPPGTHTLAVLRALTPGVRDGAGRNAS